MAHHDSDPEWDRGNLLRTCRAITELLHHLRDDPRVRAAFNAWGDRRGITQERFRRIWNDDPGDREAVIRAAQHDPDEALAMLAGIARDLHLRFSWTPAVLLWMFQYNVEKIADRERPGVPSLHPGLDEEFPTGRGPRKTLARDVAWYYRNRVKDPPDLPTTLLAEFRQTEIIPTSDVSLILHAIDRVDAWLDHPIGIGFVDGTRRVGIAFAGPDRDNL